MTRRVVVLDYGSGNVRSAVRALERVGAFVTLTADPDLAVEADGLVVPGVGAFAACMRGLHVVSEVRPRGTDPDAYADKLVAQVNELLERGVDPERITIVGASKGAVIAILASTRLRRPGVRYVLLANCNPWVIRTFDPRLTGEVLSIYEASDDLGQSCADLAARSPALTRFEEIRLDRGLGHGMVYRPLPEWVAPAVKWAER